MGTETTFNLDPSLLSHSSTTDIEFRDTSYFKVASPAIPVPPLPPPAAVLAERPHAHSAVVRYEHLGLLVKFGLPHKVRVEEAQALQALRRAFPNNEVPVPELYGWKISHGYNFIYMSIIPGQTLRAAWQHISQAEKESIATQLGAIVSALRGILQLPNKGHIGSVSGGPVQDLYFRGNPENAGPFDSIKAFNNTVHFLTAPWIPPDSRPIDPYRGLISDSGSVYFTHADLNIDNIIILRSPNRTTISGIVDWEQCGWYPEYWEYCKMHLGNPWDHEWCVSDYASRSVRSYNNELTAMVEYWQWRIP